MASNNIISNKFVNEGLTYDDVLLVPDYSEVLPRDVNFVSFFTKNIKLNTPIVTAETALETVAYQFNLAVKNHIK